MSINQQCHLTLTNKIFWGVGGGGQLCVPMFSYMQAVGRIEGATLKMVQLFICLNFHPFNHPCSILAGYHLSGVSLYSSLQGIFLKAYIQTSNNGTFYGQTLSQVCSSPPLVSGPLVSGHLSLAGFKGCLLSAGSTVLSCHVFVCFFVLFACQLFFRIPACWSTHQE